MQVPLRRRSPFAILACAGALALVLACTGAAAQSVPGSDSTASMLRPALDGNPLNLPRFRRSAPAAGTDPSRFGELPNYGYKPAVGAGSTGFDSTNAARKSKTPKTPTGTPKAKTATPGPTSAKQPVSLLPESPPALSPAEAARLRILQSRRGTAVPIDPALIAANAGVPQLRRLPLVDEKPFDPTGVLVGSFLLRPAIEVTRGYDTNPGRSSPAIGSWLWMVAPELQVNSNWARHELTANVKGGYVSYDSQHQLDRPNMDAKVNGRIDLGGFSRVDLEGRLLVGTDRPGSPNIQADLSRLPVYTTFGGSIGFGQRFNRFEVSVKGGVDRTVYQDSHFMDGQIESNVDRNMNQYGGLLRTSYDVLPGIKPFVEIGADARRHDVEPDRFGMFRNSDGVSGKAGSTFEITSKLTGEASLGYLMRRYQDPTLPNLAGMTVDASLVFVASALTVAKLTATTTANETTVQGVSGIFTREVALQVDHAFRRWLIGTVKVSRALDVYDGSPRVDYRYLASGALTTMLSREWQLKGEYRQEWRTSNVPGQGYVANVYLIGLRLQR
jgi:hypothetical protein